ncbi:hypothetical protein [Homoserinimonas sp. A520]
MTFRMPTGATSAATPSPTSSPASPVCENLRKLLTFLKEHLALRSVNAKNSGVPTIFWEPEPRADDVEPPTRC